jgi:hypothetical protein
VRYLVLLFLCSCSTTYVTVEKTVLVYNLFGHTQVKQGGSNLKDLVLDQASDAQVKLK